MKKFKKIAAISLGIILFIIVVYSVINLFDESANQKSYTVEDLPTASIDATNGFIFLWGLSEPEEVNVQSEAYIKKLRNTEDMDSSSYKKKFSVYMAAIRKIKFPKSFEKDLITFLSQKTNEIQAARDTCKVLLSRYNQLLSAATIREFTDPSFSSPIPNLLALLLTARLHTTVSISKAMEGEWQQAATDLIKQVDMARRLMPGSRTLILNLVAKAVMNISLQGLVSIINHPDCPAEILTQILDRCKPLTFKEYGTYNGFLYEYLSAANAIDNNLVEEGLEGSPLPGFLNFIFLQKNRTKNYFYKYYSKIIELEQTEPHLWPKNKIKQIDHQPEQMIQGLWFIQNPVGKVFFSIVVPRLTSVLFKSYQLRSRFEMMRILAEFQLKHTADQDIGDLLKDLDNFKAMDPCSGKAYRWSKAKKYSTASVRMA